MFTGIIETVGTIKNVSTKSGVKSLSIQAP